MAFQWNGEDSVLMNYIVLDDGTKLACVDTLRNALEWEEEFPNRPLGGENSPVGSLTMLVFLAYAEGKRNNNLACECSFAQFKNKVKDIEFADPLEETK